jgi:hypothetical protein
MVRREAEDDEDDLDKERDGRKELPPVVDDTKAWARPEKERRRLTAVTMEMDFIMILCVMWILYLVAVRKVD